MLGLIAGELTRTIVVYKLMLILSQVTSNGFLHYGQVEIDAPFENKEQCEMAAEMIEERASSINETIEYWACIPYTIDREYIKQ